MLHPKSYICARQPAHSYRRALFCPVKAVCGKFADVFAAYFSRVTRNFSSIKSKLCALFALFFFFICCLSLCCAFAASYFHDNFSCTQKQSVIALRNSVGSKFMLFRMEWNTNSTITLINPFAFYVFECTVIASSCPQKKMPPKKMFNSKGNYSISVLQLVLRQKRAKIRCQLIIALQIHNRRKFSSE